MLAVKVGDIYERKNLHEWEKVIVLARVDNYAAGMNGICSVVRYAPVLDKQRITDRVVIDFLKYYRLWKAV